MDWGEELVTAWNTHDADALVAMFAPACRYTDVPYRMTWEGHDGIRKLFELNVAFHPDYKFLRNGGFHNDRRYAWEWTISGTVSGQTVSYRGVSVGSFDEEGRIVENRDYWNPKDMPEGALG